MSNESEPSTASDEITPVHSVTVETNEVNLEGSIQLGVNKSQASGSVSKFIASNKDDESSWSSSSEDMDENDQDYEPESIRQGRKLGLNEANLNINASSVADETNKRKKSNDGSSIPVKRAYTFVNRKRNPRTTAAMRKRWIEELSDLSDGDIKAFTCCKILKCFSQCNIPFLRGKMRLYREMTYGNRRITLTQMLCSDGLIYYDGRTVCNAFLNKAFRFSFDMITAVRNGNKEEISQVAAASSSSPFCQLSLSSDRNTEQRDAIITFLERLADNCGDKMPDSAEIHLPFFRKRDVLHSFKDEFRILYPIDVSLPSNSYFYRVWRQYARNIKVRKLGRFAKCTICEQLREGLAEATKNGDHKRQSLIKKMKTEHNEMVGRERREYKKKRDKARLQPTEYMSMIVDGADQSAFGLPHFMIKTKDDRGHTIKVRLVGLLEHNQVNKLRLFTLTEEFPSGANHVIEAIHRFLAERINESALPRVFYIQVDNCTKENKNRYIFAYIESLIRWNIFDQVEVGFLPVGHTHEDIDQTFSRTSDRLRCNNAITLSDLHHELKQVYNERTTVVEMKNVANWSGLCENEKCLSNIKNFSKYRYFRFNRVAPTEETPDISTSCMVKVNVSEEWVQLNSGSRGGASGFIKFVPDLRKTPPLEIVCPDGKEKVTECISAAESRIPSTEKVQQLLELRDSVFRPRSEPFHWDLQNSVEWNNSAVLRDDETDSDEEVVENQNQQVQENDNTAHGEYTYELNSFVAVMANAEDDGTPFWIGKINKLHKNDGAVVTKITVHWFDVTDKSEIFNGKYYPSYTNEKTKRSSKRSLMKDDIPVDSVIINFKCLTKQHRLPAMVSQHLRSLKS